MNVHIRYDASIYITPLLSWKDFIKLYKTGNIKKVMSKTCIT